MLIAVLLFAFGLALLIRGGDWFVDGATSLAHKFRVPDLLIGATVVSIGTTLPEVMVSTASAVQGHSEIAYGNAIGSIICNTALIAALTIAVVPSIVDRKSLKTPAIFFYAATVMYLIVAYTTGYFSRTVGILCLAIFLVYMIYSVIQAKNADIEDDEEFQELPMRRTILYLIVGAAAIAWGADLLVDNGTLIAAGLGVPESVIALTMVALGTSLPELVTAVTSLMKGRGLLSLGNIIGANLFNLVLVNGVAATVAPYHVPNNFTESGLNMTLAIELPVMVFVMSALVLPGMIRGKLTRLQGILLLAVYVGFVIFQFTC